MEIERLDHVVLTVTNVEATCAFYEQVLGLRVIVYEDGRRALVFGNQKINLHEQGREREPKAARPTPGSADFCLVTTTPLEEAMAYVRARGVAILEGPVDRTGALGPMRSFYLRDPDGNLVEVAQY